MKIARHAKILELIENYDIETQDELAQRLCEEGFVVTQATVSRDIREMKLTKIATEKGRQKYAVITGNDTEVTERLTRVFKEAVLKMDYAQNMIVVKTLDGMGMAILSCSAAKRKLQGINNHGFAGTRFARQNIQPISKGDFAFLNQRHISDVQMFQHKASPL